MCESSAFKCKTGDQCVKEKTRCDDQPDCTDGSDEVDCDNGELLMLENVFTSLFE